MKDSFRREVELHLALVALLACWAGFMLTDYQPWLGSMPRGGPHAGVGPR